MRGRQSKTRTIAGALLIALAAAIGVADRAIAQASDQTRIVDSRAAVVRFNAGTYMVDEGAGTVTRQISVIARTRPNTIPPLRGFSVNVSTRAHSASSGDDYGSFSRRVTFSGGFGNWVAVGNAYESEKRVAVRIVSDDLDEDNETFGLLLSTGNDPLTTIGVAPADLEAASRCTADGCESLITIVDDDTRGVTVGETGPLPVQEGDSESYTVVLDSQPTGDVMITPEVSDATDADISVSESLTFTSSNWDRPQKVTVTAAVDDNAVDGSATIAHAISGGDYGATGVTAAAVSVTENDRESDQVCTPAECDNTIIIDNDLDNSEGTEEPEDTEGSKDTVGPEDPEDIEEPEPVVVTITQVPDGTVLPDGLSSSPGETVADGSTFIEGKLALFRLVFSAADGGPPSAGADVELRYRWHNESPIVPTSGQRTLTVLSLPRVEHWDSAVQILDNDVGNPDGTVTIRITGCERTLCVIGELSEITVTIADDDGGPTKAPPGQPAKPAVVCAGGGHNPQGTALRVRWQAPDFVGGAPIEGYELRYRSRPVADEEPQGGGWQPWPTPVTATSTVILGLEPDTVYGVQVRAVNANGPGQWSFESSYRTGEPRHTCDILDQSAESQ